MHAISATEMNSILAEVFGPPLESLAFEQFDGRKWVRSSKQPIREVFAILALKGLTYSPCWGVSLDFVPHVSGSSIRWHRSSKSAMFDLRYDPVDCNMSDWSISSWGDGATVKREATLIAKRALGSASKWFAAVATNLDVLAEFEKKKRRPFIRFGMYNYTQEPLAFAFALARVGRNTEAENEINAYLAGKNEFVQTKLVQLLKETQASND